MLYNVIYNEYYYFFFFLLNKKNESLVGGYDDERETSSDITKIVIEYLISETNYIFNLKLACAGFINTRFI